MSSQMPQPEPSTPEHSSSKSHTACNSGISPSRIDTFTDTANGISLFTGKPACERGDFAGCSPSPSASSSPSSPAGERLTHDNLPSPASGDDVHRKDETYGAQDDQEKVEGRLPERITKEDIKVRETPAMIFDFVGLERVGNEHLEATKSGPWSVNGPEPERTRGEKVRGTEAEADG
ncbi:uncharacterized protein AB675_8948 [Cyphellophora attinorum]|uniref:Uncharacterized protein n=1 Tax=Cyphellophora attinorum TaxID=1664694 RepID=A0A0N1NWZ5_9EURO|nr:uncharacterized protein AB675_8948 [Phialophora attinorum]KPI36154.1 hypothetical protein AB675_8948 [Phialophora attinorum]